MNPRKRARSEKALSYVANPEAPTPTLRQLGGSQSDDWNLVLANQVINTLWHVPEKGFQERQESATAAALVGISPKDEIEGMIAAQLLAAHNASMECFRRAMIPQQSFEGRRENLNQANKLSRTYSTLLEALNRHRGKGQQKVTVEHVHVHAGGQAVVGMIETPGGGDPPKSEDQAHAKQIAHAPQPRCGANTRNGTKCKSPAMLNGRCRMHGGKSPGAPKGNKNALKHGCYSAEALAWKREMSALLRAMSVLAKSHA